MRTIHRVSLAVFCAALCGCAAPYAKDTQAYRQSVMNSPAYHAGYSDGCSVANYNWSRQKLGINKASFEKDADYRQGFLVGAQNCKDSVLTTNTGKPNDHLML